MLTSYRNKPLCHSYIYTAAAETDAAYPSIAAVAVAATTMKQRRRRRKER